MLSIKANRTASLGGGVFLFVFVGSCLTFSSTLCPAAEDNAKQENGKALEITVGEPRVVGPPRRWAEVKRFGIWNFPRITRLRNGRLAVSVQVVGDSSVNYGLPRQVFLSSDGGKQWEPVGKDETQNVRHVVSPWTRAVTMPDGEQIANVTPRPLMKADMQLPKPLNRPGEITAYGGSDVCYRIGDFPRELMALEMVHRPAGQDKWIKEKGYVDMRAFTLWSDRRPHFPRPSLTLGDILLAPDGSLLAIQYNIAVNIEDKPASKCTIICLRSVDRGRTWKFLGKVPALSEPDRIYNHLYEPGTLFLDADRAICVMRSSHTNNKKHSMYISRTSDMGRTWSPPEAITEFGVMPKLVRLENGVIGLSYGRPGVYLLFSTDEGQTWGDFRLIHGPTTEGLTLDKYRSIRYVNTCGYTDVLTTGPDRFLLVYADFRYQHEGQRHKAILLREIVVKKAR